jgi:DNA-binding CsgD family transcriptional regulator
MYAGWMAAVVVRARVAVLISLLISGSVVAGYLLAGASPAQVLAGTNRDTALTSAILPTLVGFVGVLLVAATNRVFGDLPAIVSRQRMAAEASTPGLRLLFAGQPVLLPAGARSADVVGRSDGVSLSKSERDVVRLLAGGYRPKQIARMRRVSINTVRSQIRTAKKKSGVRTIDELIAVTWSTVL